MEIVERDSVDIMSEIILVLANCGCRDQSWSNEPALRLLVASSSGDTDHLVLLGHKMPVLKLE